ncbi:MAG: alpha/beta hydrolase [Anaerolineaceae bacterium]|nr:MAG: alpha/beta hydrolase [Anaerolineaceae bacterium]
MTTFTPWNSQPLSEWTGRFAAGQIIDIDGKPTHFIEAGHMPNFEKPEIFNKITIDFLQM